MGAHLAHRREPRATYLACADVHTSTSSVGWIAAHVVHVGQLLTEVVQGVCREEKCEGAQLRLE